MASGKRVRLAFQVGNAPRMSVPTKIVTVKSSDLYEKPKVVKRDSNGLAVKNKTVLKSPLNEGRIELAQGLTTRVLLNENGVRVHDRDCKDFLVTPEGETEVEPFDPTIGGGVEIEVVKFVDASKRNEYHVDKTYEVLVEETDAPMLWTLADELDKNDQMALIDIVEREGYEKSVGMVVPIVDRTAGKWTLMVYATKAKTDPIWKDIPDESTVTTATKTASKKKNTLKVDGAEEMF